MKYFKVADVALGGQWGDEGKAKVIDFLSENYQVVVRYQGGANAGHTIYFNNKKFILHHLPSGVFNPKTICVLGAGMVINLEKIWEEIDKIKQEKGISNEIYISHNAFLVFDYHLEIDRAIEEKNHNKIGTTVKGIGPAYRDKIARIGIRMQDFEFPKLLEKKINLAIEYNKNWLNPKNYTSENIEKIIKKNFFYFKKLKKNIVNTAYLLHKFSHKKILFEGAQGLGLDIDFGTYPYVTSSSTISGGVSAGTGVPPTAIKKVVGIFKAYVTRVGLGVLPTKLNKRELEKMRTLGEEFGATTGRARECGWFDGVQAKYSIMVNGISEIALTKLDIFDHYDEIKIATHYLYKGKKLDTFPTHNEVLKKIKPVYKTFPTWSGKIYGINKLEKLPDNAKKIIFFLEKYLDCPISYISTGPDREHMIIHRKL